MGCGVWGGGHKGSADLSPAGYFLTVAQPHRIVFEAVVIQGWVAL